MVLEVNSNSTELKCLKAILETLLMYVCHAREGGKEERLEER